MATDTTTNAAQAAAAKQAAANAQAISLIQTYGRLVLQPMAPPVTLDGTTLNSAPLYARINPRMAGLLRNIIVRVEADVKVPANTQLVKNLAGPSAALSRVELTDLSNNKRIDTSGIHLAMLASVRNRQPSGASFFTDTPMALGNEVGGGISYPVPAASNGDTTVTLEMTYIVPVMYANNDFRGAMWLSTTQATASLQLTVNPLFFSPTDLDAVYRYTGANAPTLGDVRIYTTQDYIDQVPYASGNPILPTVDMSKIYQLITTTTTGITPNSDFKIDFGNLRTYMSLMTRFNNGNAYNINDLNYLKLESANMYQFLNADPKTLSFRNRNALGFDLPPGMQYFGFRNQPINTTMYGNLALTLNANQVAQSGVRIDTFSEFFADTLTTGASTVG